MKDYVTKQLAHLVRHSNHASIIDDAIREACAEAIADTVKRERRRAVRLIRARRFDSPDIEEACEAIITEILGRQKGEK